MIEALDLLDSWRYVNPSIKNYTFYCHPHLSSSCIDYIFFLSKHLAYLIEYSDIGSTVISDHAPVTLTMQPFKPIEQSFYWRLNPFLFHSNNCITFLGEHTNLYLEFNDNGDTDPRLVWEAYEAYMCGIIHK